MNRIAKVDRDYFTTWGKQLLLLASMCVERMQNVFKRIRIFIKKHKTAPVMHTKSLFIITISNHKTKWRQFWSFMLVFCNVSRSWMVDEHLYFVHPIISTYATPYNIKSRRNFLKLSNNRQQQKLMKCYSYCNSVYFQKENCKTSRECVSLLSPFIRLETDVQLEGVLFSESTHQRNLPYHIEFSEQKVFTSFPSVGWSMMLHVSCSQKTRCLEAT